MPRSDSFRHLARLWLAGGFLALSAALPASVQGQQQDWPLRCNLRTAGVRFFQNGFSLDFRGASAGTRARQPATGECAWEDRGWARDEPQRLLFTVDGQLLVGVDIDSENRFRNVVVQSTAPQAAREAVARFGSAWSAGGAITFYVHREGNSLRITRIVP